MKASLKLCGAAALALAGAAVSGAPAMAQSAAERCRAMPTDAERFACLEGALAAAEALAAGRAPLAAPAPSAPRSVTDLEDNDRRGGFLRMPSIPFLGGDDDGVRDVQPAVAASGLGAEQIASRSGSSSSGEQRVAAQIISYRERVPGQWQFELDNGEVWRQLSGDGTDLRLFGGDPLPVEMWKSWAGGYRMHLVEQDRTVQVRRIR